jgi:hypothetical protein
MMKEIWLNDIRISQLGNRSLARSRHGSLSAMTFSNATVYTSHATSCGVTQLLVVPRSLARPKGLLLANIVWGELFLKFYFKKDSKIKKFSTCGAYWTRPSYPDVSWWITNRPIYIILRKPVLQWTLWIDPHPILVSCCSRPVVSAHVVSLYLHEFWQYSVVLPNCRKL